MPPRRLTYFPYDSWSINRESYITLSHMLGPQPIRAYFEEVRYCFSVPTITECTVGRHFLDSIEVGIDRVGSSTRHRSHPTFDYGIVTVRYGVHMTLASGRSKASLTKMVLRSLAALMVLTAVKLFRSALWGVPSFEPMTNVLIIIE